MRKIYMTFSAKTAAEHLRTTKDKLTFQLKEQRELNAELTRICEQQSRLLAEQSSMIEEMLEEMGR